MAVNKVVINDEVVLDLTGDTVQAADLPKGVIAHSATGDKVTGTTNYAGSSNAGGSATSAEKLNNRLTIPFLPARIESTWSFLSCVLFVFCVLVSAFILPSLYHALRGLGIGGESVFFYGNTA